MWQSVDGINYFAVFNENLIVCKSSTPQFFSCIKMKETKKLAGFSNIDAIYVILFDTANIYFIMLSFSRTM